MGLNFEVEAPQGVAEALGRALVLQYRVGSGGEGRGFQKDRRVEDEVLVEDLGVVEADIDGKAK